MGPAGKPRLLATCPLPYSLSLSLSFWPYSRGPGTARVPQNEFAHCTKIFNPILLPQLSGWLARGGRAMRACGYCHWVLGTAYLLIGHHNTLYWILGTAFYRLLLATRSTCQRLLRWWVWAGESITSRVSKAGVRLFTFRVRACLSQDPCPVCVSVAVAVTPTVTPTAMANVTVKQLYSSYSYSCASCCSCTAIKIDEA